MKYDERRLDCEYRFDGCQHPQAGYSLANTPRFPRTQVGPNKGWNCTKRVCPYESKEWRKRYVMNRNGANS